MKIEKSCENEKKLPMVLGTILNGTVFRYGNLTEGPYLRVSGGIVHLEANAFYSMSNSVAFENYVVLPNARVVTGE